MMIQARWPLLAITFVVSGCFVGETIGYVHMFRATDGAKATCSETYPVSFPRLPHRFGRTVMGCVAACQKLGFEITDSNPPDTRIVATDVAQTYDVCLIVKDR
jgi:hypothetical protein